MRARRRLNVRKNQDDSVGIALGPAPLAALRAEEGLGSKSAGIERL